MTSRDQVRAANAFAAVGGFEGNGGDYLSLARSLPQTFQTNGLLAAWAYLLAKKKGAECRAAAAALLEHFRHSAVHLVEPGAEDAEAVFRRWIDPTSPLGTRHLQALTAEAIAYAGWLKRAAEALLAGAAEERS